MLVSSPSPSLLRSRDSHAVENEEHDHPRSKARPRVAIELVLEGSVVGSVGVLSRRYRWQQVGAHTEGRRDGREVDLTLFARRF